jgi:hypothetical protein
MLGYIMNQVVISEELKVALRAFATASEARIGKRIKNRMARQWRTTMTPRELKEVAAALIKTQ